MKKKITQRVLLSILATVLAISVQAQSAWNVHQATERKGAPAQITEASTEMFLGYCDVTAQIWPSDGLSIGYNSRVGAGIVLPREIIEKYQGGVITAMYVGWDDQASYSKYNCFVRENSFSSENISTGEGNVMFGWNRIDLTPVPINDVDCLCVGFYANLKKNVCSIPYLYPQNTPNSIFLYDGVSTDENGNELWVDMHQMPNVKCLAIMLVVSDPEGNFANLIELQSFRSNRIVWRDSEIMSEMVIKNVGSNNITSITVNTSINGDTLGNLVSLSDPVGNSMTGYIEAPIYCLGSGMHDIAIVEVNEVPLEEPIVFKHDLIGVPYDLEGLYTSLPLIEWFTSEESDVALTHYEVNFEPGLRSFSDKYNLVCHHVDDKFMWGDNEGLEQMLILADNDSSKIFIPSFTVNRSDYLDYNPSLGNCPFHYGTPFPEVAPTMWTNLLKHPTFASVNINARFSEDMQKIEIDVDGNIAAGVLPEGENLNLTVYVMEKNVHTQDQLMFRESDKSFYYGEYVHPNIVRDIITPYWGEPLSIHDGDYKLSFSADVYSDYNPENLYIVAYLNRDVENGLLRQQVINSNIGSISAPESVNSVSTDDNAVVVAIDGCIYINGSCDVEVYDISGAQVANEALVKGVYIARQGEIVAKVSVR